MIGDFLILRIVILVLFLTKKATIVSFYIFMSRIAELSVVVKTSWFLRRSVLALARIFLLIFFYFRPSFDSLDLRFCL